MILSDITAIPDAFMCVELADSSVKRMYVLLHS